MLRGYGCAWHPRRTWEKRWTMGRACCPEAERYPSNQATHEVAVVTHPAPCILHPPNSALEVSLCVLHFCYSIYPFSIDRYVSKFFMKRRSGGALNEMNKEGVWA